LSNKFQEYWLGGVQFQWTPWSWGAPSRDRQISALQRRIVETEERAFTDQLKRGIEQDLASIDRLEASLADDDQIIALRESILTETRSRYRESVITSAEYVDRQTDVLSARLSRAIHRVELAQARAHLLTTLGMEVR
jgi:outer membrane protein TolC